MSPDALTAVTDLILSAETLFLAGRTSARAKARFSAAWWWTGVLLLMGTAGLVGAIDHGFVQPSAMPRYWIERPNWILLGAMTFCLLMTVAAQFFGPRGRRVLAAIGLIQFAANTAVVLLVDSFLDVILNYVPVMALLLAMSIAGLKRGTGSWEMIVGIAVMFAAAAVQASRIDVFSPLDHNGLYHVAAMVGVVLLYRGGLKLGN
jgi:hypothetical protein